MTSDRRQDTPGDDLPEWLREEQSADAAFTLPEWLDDEEAAANPPADSLVADVVAVPRVSSIVTPRIGPTDAASSTPMEDRKDRRRIPVAVVLAAIVVLLIALAAIAGWYLW